MAPILYKFTFFDILFRSLKRVKIRITYQYVVVENFDLECDFVNEFVLKSRYIIQLQIYVVISVKMI